MVLMIAPGGQQSAYVPQSQVTSYQAKGAELGVRMTAPDGTKAIVPYSQQDDYQKKGATWDVSPDNAGVKSYLAGQAMTGSIQATPQPTTAMGKLARWIDNVSDDLKYGTDKTGVGTVLKALGAHGLYNGNSEAVGDYMGSLPLGLLKAAKGAAEEVPQIVGGEKGKTWQGVKDLVGGGLQATLIPGAFVGARPGGLLDEGAELASNAASKAGEVASNAADWAANEAKGIWQGEKVAQAPAKAAIRSGVESSIADAGTPVKIAADAPITNNGATILDDHLGELQKLEKAAYQKVDDTVGFDLKAEKQQLAQDKKALNQLGNTDADITRRGNLVEAINDSEGRIADAEQKLTAAGIDPREADAIHQQRMAGQEFKKVLVRATQPDGSVNVDQLLKQSNALRYTPKFGDRLTQFFGDKAAADQYMSQLQAAQEAGVHALKAQKVAQWVGKSAGFGTIAGEAGHLAYEHWAQ